MLTAEADNDELTALYGYLGIQIAGYGICIVLAALAAAEYGKTSCNSSVIKIPLPL